MQYAHYIFLYLVESRIWNFMKVSIYTHMQVTVDNAINIATILSWLSKNFFEYETCLKK